MPKSCPQLLFPLIAFFSMVAGVAAGIAAVSHHREVETATEVRLLDPGWWPTKGSPARKEYVGSAKCAECHVAQTQSQLGTQMAHALTRASSSAAKEISSGPLQFRIGEYSYQLARSANEVVYSANDGQNSISFQIGWIFGSGMFGRTYVYQDGEKYYESRLSYYSSLRALDFTVGHPRSAPIRLGAALGRRMPTDEVSLCFGCHATAASADNRFDDAALIPGVTCEACHGPGAQHVAVMSEGAAQPATLIMNPAHLGPVDSVDFCGACHRTSVDVVLTGAKGIQTLRFPAYRLQRSRCWGKGDARITCIACHDPHLPLVTDVATYDRNCLNCHMRSAASTPMHLQRARACPVGQKNCVTCHMPKRDVQEMHGAFTDHRIAVYRPGAAFQD
jgi:hypothetical protein